MYHRDERSLVCFEILRDLASGSCLSMLPSGRSSLDPPVRDVPRELFLLHRGRRPLPGDVVVLPFHLVLSGFLPALL